MLFFFNYESFVYLFLIFLFNFFFKNGISSMPKIIISKKPTAETIDQVKGDFPISVLMNHDIKTALKPKKPKIEP